MDQATREDAVYLVLDRLGVSPSVETFEDRKKLQKLIYITQREGINLNFGYNWYLQGPYSSELTPYLFKLAENPESYKDKVTGRKLAPEVEIKLTRLRNVLGPRVSDTDLLELVASILYLGQGWQSVIRKQKPHLMERTNEALKVIQELRLPS